VIRIESLFEKAKPGVTASRLAIAARYVLTPAIFECLDLTTPGAGGEIQLTDAIPSAHAARAGARRRADGAAP
jgi:UTP--glucose-1-phosphate uridylyltransferase